MSSKKGIFFALGIVSSLAVVIPFAVPSGIGWGTAGTAQSDCYCLMCHRAHGGWEHSYPQEYTLELLHLPLPRGKP